MNVASRLGTPSLCWVLAGLLVALPACRSGPVDHPESLSRLLVDEKAPDFYDAAFKPIPPDQLEAFHLPAAPPYRLGVADVLRVRVLNTEQVPGWSGSLDVRVKDDGAIYLPTIGKVEVKDKTVLEAEAAVAARIQEAKYLPAPVVSIEVSGYEARKFYVMGEVGKPSALPVNGRTTLLEALIDVDATRQETADLEEAYVVRDQQAIPFSIEDIVRRGHPAGRLVMEEGDVVYVPHVKDRADFVFVLGAVAKPQRIEMDHLGPRGTQGSITLASAVAQAGGLVAGQANPNCISVFRGGWQCPRVYTVSECELAKYGDDIHLKPGDRIFVSPSAWARFGNTLGPTLSVISGVSSLLSLSLSALALSKR